MSWAQLIPYVPGLHLLKIKPLSNYTLLMGALLPQALFVHISKTLSLIILGISTLVFLMIGLPKELDVQSVTPAASSAILRSASLLSASLDAGAAKPLHLPNCIHSNQA